MIATRRSETRQLRRRRRGEWGWKGTGPALALLGVLASGCAIPDGRDCQCEPPHAHLEDVPNFHPVSATLYRSGQPSAAGFRRLESEIGIRTVVNLRQFHSDLDELAGTTLAHEHIWVAPWSPDREEVVRFLRIATDPDRVPVLVHCMHGADRTGLFVAAYRVVVEGWSKADAIGEMTGPSFGFHSILGNLVTWFEELDTDAIRAELGIRAAES